MHNQVPSNLAPVAEINEPKTKAATTATAIEYGRVVVTQKVTGDVKMRFSPRDTRGTIQSTAEI